MTLDRRKDVNIKLQSGRATFDLEVPYKPAFIAELKQVVPARARSYSTTTQLWTISRAYRTVVKTALEEFFETVGEVLE